MAEIFIKCQYGERRKNGKVVRPSSCTNRASGIFKVHYVRGKAKPLFLCAHCGFDKMPNHVKIVMPADDAPADAHPIYYHDVVKVELLASLDTEFEQGKRPREVGVKHWVERTVPELPEAMLSKATIKVYKSHKPKMDLAKYRDSLRKHDDGK